jgi:hypothetical protein
MILSNSFLCSHTIVYVAMKSGFRSPLWCDTSSTRVTSRSQISQSATVNLIHCLVIPCAIPVLTRGTQFWIISPVWTRHVHSVPVNPRNHSKISWFLVTVSNQGVFSFFLTKNFKYITNLVEFTLEKQTPKISLLKNFKRNL